MKDRIVESKLKCPRCKSPNLSLIEIWEAATITWEQIDGKFDRNDGSLNEGNPHRVEATCSNKECGHSWKPIKAHQIDDVIK